MSFFLYRLEHQEGGVIYIGFKEKYRNESVNPKVLIDDVLIQKLCFWRYPVKRKGADAREKKNFVSIDSYLSFMSKERP
ncbi:hypothetical protein SAMN05720354_11830 [Nitrosospira sp. Nsp1]|nr:hypothetical protein SAMN05720354_11830 [Nitrosospira sp. Nsp1]